MTAQFLQVSVEKKKPKHTDNELKFKAENLINDYSTSDSTQNVNAIPAKN